MQPKTTRVLVVDDSADLTAAMERLIGMEADLEGVGCLPSADGLLDEVERKKPDVVLMDLTMPGRPPLAAIRELAERVPSCRVVVCSGYDDARTVASAFDAGAAACVSKHNDPSVIVRAIRAAGAELLAR